MMVIDTPGTDERGQPTTASNLVQIDILANQTWPDLKMGALLSGYSIATGVKQCLTMRHLGAAPIKGFVRSAPGPLAAMVHAN